jgi:hypothetical protein
MHTVRERGKEGGTSCTPSKYFEKFCHKNAIKHENRGPPLDSLTTPSTPLKRI